MLGSLICDAFHSTNQLAGKTWCPFKRLFSYSKSSQLPDNKILFRSRVPPAVIRVAVLQCFCGVGTYLQILGHRNQCFLGAIRSGVAQVNSQQK